MSIVSYNASDETVLLNCVDRFFKITGLDICLPNVVVTKKKVFRLFRF